MARNQEKAQSMMNRYLKGKTDEQSGPKKLRPFLASEVADLQEADKWHHQIVREISKKVYEIQNAGLGEHRLRDLNDEINKLIREKGHWERRIVELGGPDYALTRATVTDSAGTEVLGGATGKGSGYRYFGAAKNLPGVKELFEQEKPRVLRRSRYHMHKAIDADYYGFRDEDDGVLLREEAAAERAIKKQMLADWQQQQAEKEAAMHSLNTTTSATAGGGNVDKEGDRLFVAYVPLPEQEEIERRVVKRKKEELLSKYASEALLRQQEEAKQLLNVAD